VALSAFFGTAAMSRDARDDDQERARIAFENGEILPIMDILARALELLPGDVVEVELQFEDEYISYEIDILTATGRVREVELDARTGAIIEISN
jgi:uncharacterized membrane protein YkoI